MSGNPHVTAKSKGELSVYCLELPIILSPSISLIPRLIEDREARVRNRHVDMLINTKTADTVRIRSHIIQYIRNFLLADKFLEVQTPIIADCSNGAIARPFTTVATEFSDKQLALRVAPEIWLKRLVIGGVDRVFEIGPAFRNEGLDATHNPEFTTCEFYKTFASLEELMSMTESMISGIATLVETQRKHPLKSLPEPDPSLKAPFKRIEFIPAIEEALGEKLPDLAGKKATRQLLTLCKKHSIKIPASTTLPRILDKLAYTYIEPQCEGPTYIIHHPACMAPLAKSFLHSDYNQIVSARAELFIQKRELANMYEEENSPFEQRIKFMQQAKFKDDENEAFIDESYLEALEWGLPPTGGWGCGIDRMVMLFSGAQRISDVLPFGSLRNVVNLGSPAPRASGIAKKLEAVATASTKLSKKKLKQKLKYAAAFEAAKKKEELVPGKVSPEAESVAASEESPPEQPSSGVDEELIPVEAIATAIKPLTRWKKRREKLAAIEAAKKNEVVEALPEAESVVAPETSAPEPESSGEVEASATANKPSTKWKKKKEKKKLAAIEAAKKTEVVDAPPESKSVAAPEESALQPESSSEVVDEAPPKKMSGAM